MTRIEIISGFTSIDDLEELDRLRSFLDLFFRSTRLGEIFGPDMILNDVSGHTVVRKDSEGFVRGAFRRFTGETDPVSPGLELKIFRWMCEQTLQDDTVDEKSTSGSAIQD